MAVRGRVEVICSGFAREIVYLIGQTNSRLSGKVTEIQKPITVATTMVGVVFV